MTNEEIITRLKKSGSYMETQNIISEFADISLLNQRDMDECIDIAMNNSQVLGKLKYKDGNIVRKFYRELLQFYNGESGGNVEQIKEVVYLINNSDIVSFLENEKRAVREKFKNLIWQDEQTNISFTVCDGLYHANSVSTSISFIRHKMVYSREYGNYFFPKEQTSQWSDEKDKQCGVFNDIFFDNCDCRLLSKKESAYGPVTFVIDETILENASINVRITKCNPAMKKSDWLSKQYESKYFIDIKELVDCAQKVQYPFRTNFSHHTTICNRDFIDITEKVVKYIIVERNENLDISFAIKERLKKELFCVGLCNIPVVIRNECPSINSEIKRAASDEDLWKLPR